MWDRIVNFVYSFIKDMSSTTFYIMMGVIITLAFYNLSVFLKANKKESAKVSKISRLLITIFILEKALRPFTKKYLYKEEKVGIDEYLDDEDQYGVDTSVPPRFDCENCPGKMIPIFYVGVNGKIYSYSNEK